MKRLLLIVLPLLLIVGCSKEPINIETTLVERDGVFYTKDTNKPYTGQVFSLYDDGKKKGEGTLKDGELHGLRTSWNKNGQKKSEGTYKDGEFHGLRTIWFENGQMKYKGTWKNEKLDGLQTGWYENGQKKGEATWKNGELISKKEWNEDGSVKE